MRAAGAELALDEAAALDEALQGGGDDGDAEAVAFGDVRRSEGAMRPGVSENEVAEGVGDRLEVALGDARGDGDAEGIAISRRIFDGDVAVSDFDHAS